VYLQPLLCNPSREITQKLGLLRCSRSFKVTDFGTNRKLVCDFILVINSNLPAILHRFRVQNSYIWLPLFGLIPPDGGGGFPWKWYDLCNFFTERSQMAKVPNGVETLPKILIAWVERTNVTDRRQTDRRTTNVNSRA